MAEQSPADRVRARTQVSSQMSVQPATDCERLGFLLARHGRIMNVRLRQALGVTGLGPRHAATLMRLAREGATSQQNLIEVLATDASALVTILNDLENDGLVQRRRDPADRRRHIVEITRRGGSAARAVERAVAEVEQEAVASLSEAEVGQLQTLLSRLRSGQSEMECDPD
jgi:DNA-binding MarR family transcriptional regulator